MGFGVGVSVLRWPFSAMPQHSDRIMSRFFLNLRSVFSRGQPTLAGQSVPSALSPFGTHPSWKPTTGISAGLSEAETSVYGSLFDIKEGNVPGAATVDLELAVVSRTQQGGDEPPEAN